MGSLLWRILAEEVLSGTKSVDNGVCHLSDGNIFARGAKIRKARGIHTYEAGQHGAKGVDCKSKV